MSRPLPTIALTLGDVAGIGPEVVVRACADLRVSAACQPVIVGHPDVVRRAITHADLKFEVADVAQPDESPPLGKIACWNPPNAPNDVDDVPPGHIDARAGRAAYEYLVAAAKAALAKQVAAITTAPLSKAALHLAGKKYPGHTEILAEVCGVREFGMMLFLPSGNAVKSPHGLGVVHVTLHTSIRSVPDLLTTTGVAEKIELIDSFMRRVGCVAPRIAVCALNPHAGEEGIFGDEESRIIAPAVQTVLGQGRINVTGPLPADTLFRRAAAGEFDAVVAMYHDQGHIAFKLIGFQSAVNVTLGLPIVRTSPSHGTAFDIAWQRSADPSGMIEAILVAAKLL
ncbi:MAG: 4-hydroxythreonine-4-phosphate dehydrogenase [Planctomycetota bacterium]|nr:MAG: 4-hydroxythreonine-4-phosphate dehydrogenase [Planctomycetota bacterium]